MKLGSEPNLNRAETTQERCERNIGSFIQDLDTKYSTQAVNASLQDLFVPPSTDGPPHELTHVIMARLQELQSEFGEGTVTSALYEVDKRRFPHPDKEAAKAEAARSTKVLREKVLAAAASLDRDTIKILVGDDEWEIQEFEAKIDASMQHNPRDPKTLNKMSDLLTKIKEVEGSDDPDKIEKIKQLGAEFSGL